MFTFYVSPSITFHIPAVHIPDDDSMTYDCLFVHFYTHILELISYSLLPKSGFFKEATASFVLLFCTIRHILHDREGKPNCGGVCKLIVKVMKYRKKRKPLGKQGLVLYQFIKKQDGG